MAATTTAPCVELDTGYAWKCEQELFGEVRVAADGAAAAVALDFGGCAFADDAALVDDDDAMGEGVGLFEVVRGEEDGLSLSG